MARDESPTVLLIEDEAPVAAVYEAWLRGDYDLRTAMDGEAAMAALDDDVDVVLLDRRMPGPSGDEVLAEIRERGLDVRVSMVTAVAPDFDFIDMGFDDYVVKPVSEDELLGTVERLLRASDYDAELREYFSLVTKKAALDTEMSATRLAESEEYAALAEELHAARARLDDMMADLHPEDYDAMFRSFATGVEGGTVAP